MSANPQSEQIRKQIEFYFCNANVARDDFLKEKIAEHREGYVTIACLLTFKRLAALTTDPQVVAEAVRGSAALSLSDDALSIRRAEPIDESYDHKKHTSVLFPVPGPLTEEALREAIAKVSSVDNIEAIWRKSKKHPSTKLSVNIAEINWKNESDVATFLEKSENGKNIVFPSGEERAEKEVTAMSRTEFDAQFSKTEAAPAPKSKCADYTIADIANKVLDLTTEGPLGKVRPVKSIVGETLRTQIAYVHVLENVDNRMLVVFETEEACAEAAKIYAEASIPSQEGEETESQKISVAVVEDEAVLNTVLIGYKERAERFVDGKPVRRHGHHGGYGRGRGHQGGYGRKRTWGRR